MRSGEGCLVRGGRGRPGRPSGSTELWKKRKCPCPPAMPKSRETQRAERNPIYDLRQKSTVGNPQVNFSSEEEMLHSDGQVPNPTGKREEWAAG